MGTDTSKSANERSVLEYLIGERNLPINRSSIAKLLGDRMPDFRATTLDGELVAFEITEICAQEVARLISEAKRGETFAIHTADPTSYILTSKLSKRYAIDYPIELVCFWGGRTISTDDMIVPTMQCILESALANPFRRVWYVGEEEFREFPSAA